MTETGQGSFPCRDPTGTPQSGGVSEFRRSLYELAEGRKGFIWEGQSVLYYHFPHFQTITNGIHLFTLAYIESWANEKPPLPNTLWFRTCTVRLDLSCGKKEGEFLLLRALVCLAKGVLLLVLSPPTAVKGYEAISLQRLLVYGNCTNM